MICETPECETPITSERTCVYRRRTQGRYLLCRSCAMKAWHASRPAGAKHLSNERRRATLARKVRR